MSAGAERRHSMRWSGNQHSRIWATVLQICKFSVVGVLNNVISLAVYYIVIYLDSTLYLFGNVLGFIISTLNSYILNSHFVFDSRKSGSTAKKMLGKTYIVYICSLLISTALLFLLVQIFGISERIAPICALAVTVPFNYLMNKLWVYRENKTTVM